MTRKTVLIMYRATSPFKVAHLERALKAARECGYRPHLLAPCATPLAISAATLHECANFFDVPAVRAQVRALCRQHGISRLVALDEDNVHTAALCRADNDLPGLQPRSSIYFRDKNAMNVKAAELGVRVPQFCLPHTLDTVKAFAAQVGYPLVIKPFNGAGSVNTWKVNGPEQLAEIWRLIRDDRHNFRVEQYLRGMQFHIDALVRSGEIVFEMLSQYTGHLLDFRDDVDSGGTFTLRRAHGSAHREMLSTHAKLLHGFGLHTGVVHSEFYLTESGQVFFGETAARAGGGAIAEELETACGIHLVEEAMRMELDPAHRPVAWEGPEVGTNLLWSQTVGEIAAITPVAELLAIPGMVNAQLWKKKGDRVDAPQNSADALGYYVCRGASSAEILQTFRAVKERFLVQTGSDSRAH
jgi:biotin carboxylase